MFCFLTSAVSQVLRNVRSPAGSISWLRFTGKFFSTIEERARDLGPNCFRLLFGHKNYQFHSSWAFWWLLFRNLSSLTKEYKRMNTVIAFTRKTKSYSMSFWVKKLTNVSGVTSAQINCTFRTKYFIQICQLIPT